MTKQLKHITSTPFTSFMRFIFLLILVYIVGGIGGSFVSADSLIWYNKLNLAPLSPPNSWFGIAWGMLYFLMAYSAWMVWGQTTPRPFVLQLAFNLLWPFLFFYMQAPILALLDIILMVFFIILTIRKFGAVSKVSGWLMIPTLLWSLFAFYLNLFVVLYN